MWTLMLLAGVLGTETSRGEAVELALGALAGELSAEVAELDVVAVHEVRWPDRGLGCGVRSGGEGAEPTPGFRVLVRFDAAIHRVHVGGDRALVCGPALAVKRAPEPLAIEPGSEKREPEPGGALAEAVDRAREDLAAREGIDPSSVELISARHVTWRDASLGCPQPEMGYAQSLRPGYQVVLRVGKRRFHYHGGSGGPPSLCEAPQAPLRETGGGPEPIRPAAGVDGYPSR